MRKNLHEKNKKSLFKKIAAFGLTSIASMALLAGCGSNANSSAAAKGTDAANTEAG